MSEFKESDFDGLMFPVHRADNSIDFRDQFAEFKLYPEFSVKIPSELDRNNLIKYIVFCYDKSSPFRKKYKNLMERKLHAAMEAGFEMTDGEFSKEVEMVVDCTSPNINSMIIAYCRLHNSMTYRHLVLVEQLYFNKEKDVFLGQTALKMSELRSIREEFDRTMAEFLADENSKGVRKGLYESINQERLALAPEDIAKKIQEKGYENAI